MPTVALFHVVQYTRTIKPRTTDAGQGNRGDLLAALTCVDQFGGSRPGARDYEDKASSGGKCRKAIAF